MPALVLNCTLKPSPAESNTEALAGHLTGALEREAVAIDVIRMVDHDVKPGASNDEGEGDAWPAVLERVLERLDAPLSETDDEGRPVAYNRDLRDLRSSR